VPCNLSKFRIYAGAVAGMRLAEIQPQRARAKSAVVVTGGGLRTVEMLEDIIAGTRGAAEQNYDCT